MNEPRHSKFQRLIDYCAGLPDEPCGIVHPCDVPSLSGAIRAAQMGLISPILIGPRARIEAAAEEAGLDIGPYELLDAAHSHEAAERGTQLVAEGRATMLMKGSLHTDELLASVVSRAAGLRTERRISHCFVMDVPLLDRVVIIADAAINIFPTLAEKVDMTPARVREIMRISQDPLSLDSPVGEEDDSNLADFIACNRLHASARPYLVSVSTMARRRA